MACAGIALGAVQHAAAQGANTPFVSYEAESGTVGGGATVVSLANPPTTEFSSPQLEASGHAYVHLAGNGQYVQWVNNTGKAISTLNVRYSIPDSSGGGGISSTLDLYVDGTLRGTIPVNSLQTWVYEASTNYNGMSQTPSSGNPHVFWDEAGVIVPGGAIPSGSVIKLQKDSANSAAYYNIDVIDLEAPTALAQPANSLSIMSYGAVSNNASFDNFNAIQNCCNAALSQGKSVWIPAGSFYVATGGALHITNVVVQGAGPWFSTLICTKGNWANGYFILSSSASFKNLSLDATGPNSTPGMYAILGEGNGWTIDTVWSRHMMLVWGSGVGIAVRNSRVNNSWGDGLQINNVLGEVCSNVLVFNNFSRGNGDDAISLDSASTSEPPVAFATVTNNTTVASWWANQMGIYGGHNLTIVNNLFCDSVKKTGIELNAGFGALPPHDVTVVGNTVLRGGSYGYAADQAGMIIEGSGTNLTVNNNLIKSSMFEGFEILSNVNLLIENNRIDMTGAGTKGITIDSTAGGTGTFQANIVQHLASGQSAFVNNSGKFTATQTGNNWQGALFYQNAQYGGTVGQPLPVGTYTLAQLAAKGVPNDWASSMRIIPGGHTVIIYSDDNFSGTSWTLTDDTPDFSTLSPSANDLMSSCKVQ